MSNFASDKLGAGTILWSKTERPIVAPDGTMYWDVTDENIYLRQNSAWVLITAGTGYAPIASPTFTGVVTTPSIAINGGTAVTAQTGTGGTVAMSASPTFTGTVNTTNRLGTGGITAYGSLASGNVGGTSGEVILTGSTSGFATIVGPAVAGTVTNPILISNSVTLAATTTLSAPHIIATVDLTIGSGTAITGQSGTGGTVVMTAAPTFTGVPLAPTAANGTNTTQIATTAFVLANTGGTQVPIVLNGGTDAIPAHTSATYIVTTAGVDAMTIAAPTVTTDDGLLITVETSTNAAHTLTFTGGTLRPGTAAVTTVNFLSYTGSSVTIMAWQGNWYVKAANVASYT